MEYLGTFGIVGILVLIFLQLRSRSNDKEISRLEGQKDVKKEQVEALKEEAALINDKVAKEQANASEEKIDEFWKNHLNNPDRK